MASNHAPETSPTPDLNYADESPGNWAERLRLFKEKGATRVRTRVAWGAHEPIKGMRDFAKSSRLRLERFLRLAVEEKFSVELVIGFSPGKETFPSWVHEGIKQSWVPASLWKTGSHGFGLAQVPALFDPTFLEGFFSFVDDILAIVTLYQSPGGPVEKIVFDTGVYELGLTAMEDPLFVEALQERYTTIAELNRCYHTSFKDFQAASSRQGFRTIADKRPWLAAYDYKLGREKAVHRIFSGVRALANFPAVQSIFTFQRPAFLRKGKASEWGLLLDGMLVELSSDGRYFTFSPGGFVNETAINAFRLWEYFGEASEERGIYFGALPPFSHFDEAMPPLLAVVAGKFIHSEAFTAMVDLIEGGGKLLFPLALPQYDETLQSFDWGMGKKTMIKLGDQSFLRFQRGAGEAWVLVPPLAVGPGLAVKLDQVCGMILKGGPTP